MDMESNPGSTDAKQQSWLDFIDSEAYPGEEQLRSCYLDM